MNHFSKTSIFSFSFLNSATAIALEITTVDHVFAIGRAEFPETGKETVMIPAASLTQSVVSEKSRVTSALQNQSRILAQ